MANDEGPKSHAPRDDEPRQETDRDDGVNKSSTDEPVGWNGIERRRGNYIRGPYEPDIHDKRRFGVLYAESEYERGRREAVGEREQKEREEQAQQKSDAAQIRAAVEWLTRWKRRWVSFAIWAISLLGTATVTCWLSTGDIPAGLRVGLHWMLIWAHNHTRGEYGP
jgi:hypothetical protein